MKKVLLLSVLAPLACAAGAQEVANVVSSVPVIQQVAVQREVCTQQPAVVEKPTTGAGAVIGAIAGGAVGNSIGGGSGRAAATAIGVIGGAVLGNSIEGRGSEVRNVQSCSMQTFYENRTSGYNVTYEYAGKQYMVQMPYDPGPTLRVQVTPVGVQSPTMVTTPPSYGTPPPAYITVPPVSAPPRPQPYRPIS